jgi:alpha-beta hydrolase superfamily lysophospholipase
MTTVDTRVTAPFNSLVLPGDPPLGARLYMPPGGRVLGGAVLAHGLASCQEEYGDLAERLAQSGIAALAFDFRGHGASGGERGLSTQEGHDADLARAVDELSAQSAAISANLFLIGHSVGTASVVRLLGTQPGRFAGAILLAPVAVPGEAVAAPMRLVYEGLFNVAKGIHGAIGFHVHVPYQFDYPHLFADPEAARKAAEKGFLQRSVSLMSFPYLFKEIDNVTAAGKITVPVLVVVGSEDRVIPNEHSRRVFEAIVHPDKEWVRIVGAGHSMLTDRGADQTLRLLCDWVADQARRTVDEQ